MLNRKKKARRAEKPKGLRRGGWGSWGDGSAVSPIPTS